MTLFLSMLAMLVIGLVIGGYFGYTRGVDATIYLFLMYTSATEQEFIDMIKQLKEEK